MEEWHWAFFFHVIHAVHDYNRVAFVSFGDQNLVFLDFKVEALNDTLEFSISQRNFSGVEEFGCTTISFWYPRFRFDAVISATIRSFIVSGEGGGGLNTFNPSIEGLPPLQIWKWIPFLLR